MSLCNHTIVSHGSFSYWAGYLAGGFVIRPEHFDIYRYDYDYILEGEFIMIFRLIPANPVKNVLIFTIQNITVHIMCTYYFSADTLW